MVATLLVRHAVWVSPPKRKDWVQAMRHELDHIPLGVSALQWAVGCVLVSYIERIRFMTRSLTTLPRWLLALEMTVCLAPLTLLFIAILAAIARGLMPVEYGVLYGSMSVLGPVGLAVAVRLILFSGDAVGRTTVVALVLLAPWTVVACSGQVLHDGAPFSNTWRDFVLIALLPALGAIHLVHIISERRAAPVTS
jgi:hypothetical protein